MFVHCVVFLVLFRISVESSKILVVVPTPSISHQMVFRPLVKGLLDRGHEIVLITTDPIYPEKNGPENLTEIDVHDISYKPWPNVLTNLIDNKLSDMLSVMTVGYRVLSEVFGEQLKDKAVQKILRDRTIKFDLLILEACITPALIFSHIFKAPVIQMSSLGPIPGTMHAMGAATHPLLYPTIYHENLYNLTIWEKLMELYNHIALDWMFDKREKDDHAIFQSILGNEIPPFNELKNNVDMLFLNVHPIWIDNQPVPPSVLSIWGIHETPNQTLSKDLQSYLDSSKNGVIYFSFGTNVFTSLIPSEKLNIFVKVLSRVPYDILWKWDKVELPGRSHNIKISKWVAQSELLKHPKVKLFVTQGGLQSTEEAIIAGVPLIGIPVFADQTYNTQKYPHFKIGVKLDFNSVTEEIFENAIFTVISNESYRQNIIQLRNYMYDQPQPPLQRAIWWTEYVLRHGGAKHLRAPAANMSWTEYYELELVLVVLTCSVTLFIVAFFVLYFFCRYVSGFFRGVKLKML